MNENELKSGYVISSSDVGADVTVVCFNHLNSNDTRAPGFSERFFRGRNVNYIGVKTPADDWYESLPHSDVAGEIGALSNPGRVIFFGSSMGAFAAIKYASCYPGSTVLAISPQAFAGPDFVGLEDRWRPQWLKMASSTRLVADPRVSIGLTCIYDSKNADRVHAQLIGEAFGSSAMLIDFRFSGHPSGERLHRAGLLTQIEDELILGDGNSHFENHLRAWDEYCARDSDAGVVRSKMVDIAGLSWRDFYEFVGQNAQAIVGASLDVRLAALRALTDARHPIAAVVPWIHFCAAADAGNQHARANVAIVAKRHGLQVLAEHLRGRIRTQNESGVDRVLEFVDKARLVEPVLNIPEQIALRWARGDFSVLPDS